MRQHPISPVTEPTQYRAIGVVRGQYVPADAEQLTRGVIRTADGTEIEAVVLGRLLTLMRRHLDLAEAHLWVVYPRTREENHLHLQMVGVWEPSTLAQVDQALEAGVRSATAGDPSESEPRADGERLPEAESLSEAESRSEGESLAAPISLAEAASGSEPPTAGMSSIAASSTDATSPDTGIDALPEGDDYFSVRGELIYTRPETGDLVIKVRQQPRADGSRPVPFKLQLKGEIPLQHLRHFVSLDLRRQGQQLTLEAHEVLEPVAQRGNRGGKAGGKGGAQGRRSAAGGGERGAGAGAGGGRPRPPESGPSRPAAHGKAVSRPGR